jgi:hypothetical protein
MTSIEEIETRSHGKLYGVKLKGGGKELAVAGPG